MTPSPRLVRAVAPIVVDGGSLDVPANELGIVAAVEAPRFCAWVRFGTRPPLIVLNHEITEACPASKVAWR